MKLKMKSPLQVQNGYEIAAWAHNRLVVGVDEVGRGCLAGPLVTAAVMLDKESSNPLIRDSKIMTAAQRAKAYDWIISHGKFGIGIVSHRIIEEQNIYRATLTAMKRAVNSLLIQTKTVPEAILVDAIPLCLVDTNHPLIPVHHFNKGESLSISIAAASIVAKVYRDALMKEYADLFPGYCFENHKGYATKSHQEALAKSGACLIHRSTFLRNMPKIGEPKDEVYQRTIG